MKNFETLIEESNTKSLNLENKVLKYIHCAILTLHYYYFEISALKYCISASIIISAMFNTDGKI
jgi:hypothetical protein